MKRKSHPRGRRKEPSENADGSQIDLSDSFRLWWKAQGLVLGRFWAKTVLHLRWILLLLSHVSHVRLCATPQTAAHRAPIPGILQVRTLEWVTISFSSAWKWKVKVKSLSPVWLFTTPWTAAYQAPPSMGFSWQEYWSGLPLPSPDETLSLYKNLHTDV